MTPWRHPGSGPRRSPPSYRALAAAIARITGRDRLLGVYFNGGQQLADFVRALGPGTLAQLKTATATDTGQALRLLEAAAASAA